MLAGTSYASMRGFSTGSGQNSFTRPAKLPLPKRWKPKWRKGDPAGSTGPSPPFKGTILAVFAEPAEPERSGGRPEPSSKGGVLETFIKRQFQDVSEKIICLELYSRHFYQY